MIDSLAAVHIVMPTTGSSARWQAPVGIHDFADARKTVVDGGPAPAMTCFGGR